MQCMIIVFAFKYFSIQNVRWYTMILTVLKPAVFRSMGKTVRVNATATTDCVTINWVVRNLMVCFVRISVSNYHKLCKVLICYHFYFFFQQTLSNPYRKHHMEHQSLSVTQPQNWQKQSYLKTPLFFKPCMQSSIFLHSCCIC